MSTSAATAGRLRPHPERSYLALLLGLTFTTGIVDAVGYLGLGKVFAGNMTGNVAILGMALTGADHLPVLGPCVALTCFLAGAACAGRALRKEGIGWTGRCTMLIAGVGLVLAAAAVALSVADLRMPPFDHAVAGVLAAAMGVQAATARQLAVKDVTTVVVTSTITALAADSWAGAARAQPWPRRAAAVVLISAGAGAGAALLTLNAGCAVGAAAVFTVAVALIGHTVARRAAAPADARTGAAGQAGESLSRIQ